MLGVVKLNPVGGLWTPERTLAALFALKMPAGCKGCDAATGAAAAAAEAGGNVPGFPGAKDDAPPPPPPLALLLVPLPPLPALPVLPLAVKLRTTLPVLLVLWCMPLTWPCGE
jgi:hypothetical protein